MKQKIYIIKITFMIFMFFAFAISKSFAMTGIIDTSVENKVKICKDVTCTNPPPGIIDFNMNDGSPIVIDTEKGISGKAWGGEFGWITFDGVFFADPAIGVLKGAALSATSGVINFFVTGQKVIIDPLTGEWNGWAWASGPYGGWVKFDCKQKSCVRTMWKREEPAIAVPPPVSLPIIPPSILSDTSVEENIPIPPPAVVAPVPDAPAPETNTGEKISLVSYTAFWKPSEMLRNVLDNFSVNFTNLFNKTAEVAVNAYDFLFSFLINLRNSFL